MTDQRKPCLALNPDSPRTARLAGQAAATRASSGETAGGLALPAAATLLAITAGAALGGALTSGNRLGVAAGTLTGLTVALLAFIIRQITTDGYLPGWWAEHWITASQLEDNQQLNDRLVVELGPAGHRWQAKHNGLDATVASWQHHNSSPDTARQIWQGAQLAAALRDSQTRQAQLALQRRWEEAAALDGSVAEQARKLAIIDARLTGAPTSAPSAQTPHLIAGLSVALANVT